MDDYVRVPETDWQNILDAVRGKTGSTEKMVSGVVASEIAGIQSGSSSGSTSGIYMAKVTPAENVGALTITHNLGTSDILFALCFADDMCGVEPSSLSNVIAKAWMNTNLNVRYGLKNPGGFSSLWFYDLSNTRVENAFPNNGNMWDKVLDDNTFIFEKGKSGFSYLAGVTYTVIIMAASAFSVTEV